MSTAISRRSFLAVIPLAIGALATLSGCGDGSDAEPLDLTGTWVSLSNDGEINMTAVIEGDEITIYWGDSVDNLFSVFWAGSYEAPNKSTNSWSWESKRDEDKFGIAFAATDADTIEFTYKNDVITFEASLYGLIQTAELQRLSNDTGVTVVEEVAEVEEPEENEDAVTQLKNNLVTYEYNIYRDEYGNFIVTKVDPGIDTSDWDGIFMSLEVTGNESQAMFDAIFDATLQITEGQYDELLAIRREALGLE